jgi:hypothetical protein
MDAEPITMRAGLIVVVLVALSWVAPAWSQINFSDQTFGADIDHLPFIAGGMIYAGGAVADFNGDGWPDIFLLGGEEGDALYINDQDGTFTDEATAWGVDLIHRGHGAAAGDYNNDGWTDLYVTSGGDVTGSDLPGRHLLYRNNGDGTFTDVAAAAGVHQTSATDGDATSAAFGDYDLDGDLDLFVCTTGATGTTDGNRLFRNNSDGTFTDVTVSAGITIGMNGFSPRFVDMNADRYPELLVAADYRTSRYYLNNGNGTFADLTVPSGTSLESNGMGQAVADFNRDGLQDWYVTSIYRDLQSLNQDGNYLYVNQGNNTFSSPAAHGARDGGWGWGTATLDFDHDGFIDLAETNGWQDAEYYGEVSYLFRNQGDLTFAPVQGMTGFDHNWDGRALMTLDYDQDGDIDILITANNGLVALYRNDLAGPFIHWLEVHLDTDGNPALAPDGIGSVVRATTGTVTQHFYMSPGATYLGQSENVAHFGLGAATIVDQLEVEWTDGSSTILNSVAADQILTLSAPAGAGAPGEASAPASQMTVSYNKGTGVIDLNYDPACDATEHTVYYGNLANVGSYTYADAVCNVGASGAASFDTTGHDQLFFVIVGNNGTVEGSFGHNGTGVERPEDTLATGVCDHTRDLTGTCF